MTNFHAITEVAIVALAAVFTGVRIPITTVVKFVAERHFQIAGVSGALTGTVDAGGGASAEISIITIRIAFAGTIAATGTGFRIRIAASGGS